MAQGRTAQQPLQNIAAELVNPFIGTGGHGHTFPGACVPNGMVQLSPDTRPDGYSDWDGASGYHYSDSVIYGFSHTHLSGTGVSDLCDVLLMPMSSTPSLRPEAYRSSFRKGSEHAHAGYYKVHLDGPNVEVELTSTARTGIHRYTFPEGTEAHVVLDLEHRDHVERTSILRVNDREVMGERRSSSWARDQRLFYCIRFSHPFQEVPGRNGISEQIAATLRSQDHFSFGDLRGDPLIVKVGISAVSAEGARRNLDAEAAHWDFDRYRKDAERAWNAKLGRVQLRGGTREQQRTFYTALYHCYIAPALFNDADGQYRGMDGAVHHADHDVYTIFSLWDTFRALHPLMTILEPGMTADWVRTMLLHYQQGGRLPVWELWGNETDCMIGYHAVSVIADAYLKGIRGFDAELALKAMVESATQEDFGIGAYQRQGFISSEDAAESVSRTLEYAYDDRCIARMAEALGKNEVATRFLTRSRNWQNLFDPVTKFFRPRRNGGFVEPFDPYEVNFHYTEANAWQYSLFVPHDVEHHVHLLGGPAGLTKRLDALFTADERTTGRQQSDITGLIGQYAHGNEPSHHFAYLYNLSSRPHSTDVYVARIMRELYTDAPDGLAGNEDCGQMSAWYVLGALGFYPLAPGNTSYTLGLPLFEEATLYLAPDRVLRITGTSEQGARDHVVYTLWNGNEHDAFRSIEHADLVKGGHLHFELGPRPGSAPVPSSSELDPQQPTVQVPVPVLRSAAQVFRDALDVEVTCADAEAGLRYRINGEDWLPYKGAILLTEPCTLEAQAFRRLADGSLQVSKTALAHYTQLQHDLAIALHSAYAPEYTAGGDQALVDGLRGGTDFRTGPWQGYRGQHVVLSIDLGRTRKVKRLGIGALQDARSWIWFPSEVVFSLSTNNRQWSTMTISNTTSRQEEGSLVKELWTGALDRRARYIEVEVRNAGPCPEWHPGAGLPSWLFLDELLFELDQ